ncbi:hypothetical protein EON81_15410 [bacterium]|nr:MAG: hypothetical protein EON81_15410 [bacterium]
MPIFALPPLVYVTQIDNGLSRNIAEIQFQNADVREAVRNLFKVAGSPGYSIDPKVQGTVTASFTNVTTEVALQNILRQVDATYRVEAGIVQILKKDGTAPIAQANAAGTGVRTPAHEAIIALFRANAVRYVSSVVASPGLDYSLEGLHYTDAVKSLAKMADLELTFEDGVAYLRPRTTSGGFGGGSGEGSGRGGFEMAMPTPASQAWVPAGAERATAVATPRPIIGAARASAVKVAAKTPAKKSTAKKSKPKKK